MLPRATQIGVNLRDKRCEPCLILDPFRVRQLLRQISFERDCVIAESDLADMPLAVAATSTIPRAVWAVAKCTTNLAPLRR